MPPDNFLRTPCFLKWVGWRYDQTAEIGKIQGSQEKRTLFLSTSSSKQSPTVCSWALPWEGQKATEGGIWCLCVFPWCDIVIYNKKCIFILIPDTGLLKSFTNHLTNIYVTNISGTLTSDWEMKPKVCSQHWEWTWVTSSIYVVK